MSASSKSTRTSPGVTMNNLSQATPDDVVPPAARAENNQSAQMISRVSLSKVDPEILAELKGFTLWLAQVGGRDGLLTMGDVVTAALAGEGDLPSWRDKYNKGKKFPLAVSVPPGRK